jgi:hypothetical protein
VEQDRTLGLAVDFALNQVLLGTVPGTARITHLSVEDGYLNLSIRAKVDSIQLSSEGIVKSPEPRPPALAPADDVVGKPDQADVAGPIGTGARSSREAAPGKDTPSLNQFEDLDEKPALKPTAPDLEELDDVAGVAEEVRALEPKPAFELEEL